MKMIEQQLLDEVVRLGQASPDYIYPASILRGGCFYTSSGTDSSGKPLEPECKGCIFGQALQNLGVGKSVLEKNSSVYISGLLFGLHIDDSKYGLLFESCQSAQDSGSPWGKAIAPLVEFASKTC